MHIKKEISPKKVQQDAEENFRKGFYCCEALICAIRDNFELDVPQQVIAMASGMAVGAGQAGCMCGAFNGGTMALGLFFGRTEPRGPEDPQSVKCLQLTRELYDWFKEANGKNTLCCRVLTRQFTLSPEEHAQQCVWLTGLCALKTAQIIVRELGLTNLDEQPALDK